MSFCEVELLSLPKIKFACSVDLERYHNSFHKIPNFLELCIHEEGRILYKYPDGSQYLSHPGILSAAFYDSEYETSAYENDHQRHTTVGVTMDYRYHHYESEADCDLSQLKARLQAGNRFLFPYRQNLDDAYPEILHAIKKISLPHASSEPGDRMAALAEWYHLTALLTRLTMRHLERFHSQLPPSELYYCEKAVRYLHDHYRDPLTVADLAHHLGISEGYLHRLFRQVKGMGPLECRNRHRISLVIDWMEHHALSLKDAGRNAGIDDPAYLSRLFKRVTGLSCREYFRQNTP